MIRGYLISFLVQEIVGPFNQSATNFPKCRSKRDITSLHSLHFGDNASIYFIEKKCTFLKHRLLYNYNKGYRLFEERVYVRLVLGRVTRRINRPSEKLSNCCVHKLRKLTVPMNTSSRVVQPCSFIQHCTTVFTI